MKSSRLFIALGALVIAVAGTTLPAAASTDVASGSTSECVLRSVEANAVRAHLTPGAAVAQDAAYNLDDPDADGSSLELIRFPDETGLWLSTGAPHLAESLSAGSDTTATATRAFAFTGPERLDRSVSDSIIRLYCGLFDRQPTAFELEYWAGRYWNGLPLVTIAESFTHAQEFVDRFGVVSDLGLVTVLYNEVLGRQSASGGAQTIVARLASGDIHRGEAVVQFTESSEYVFRTGTVAPAKPTLPYPDVGSGRRIVMTDRGQRVWLINGTGELAKTHQISGRRGVPGVGRYKVYSMSRYAWAPYDGITMEFMVRFARGEWPYGFHSIPVWPGDDPLQTPAQLGTHRSGGCVRQLWDDAEAVFDWAEIGDRVIIIP